MKVRCSPLAALVAGFAFAAASCSSETTGSTSGSNAAPAVASDATLTIQSPADGACFPIPSDPDATIPITVALHSLQLRPPGQCVDFLTSICGRLKVSVNGVFNNEGVTPTVNVLLRPIDRYAELSIKLVLVDDSDQPRQVIPLNSAGAVAGSARPLEATITLNPKSCAPSTSTTSASSSSASSSSASSSSGGGSTSSSGSGGGSTASSSSGGGSTSSSSASSGGAGGAGSDAGADGG